MKINRVITYQVTGKNSNIDIGLPQEIIDQLEGNDHHPPKPQPTFGYKWKAKALYKKGKLPTVKYDVSGRKLTSKNATIVKNVATNTVTDDANPSKPSVKLTPLTVPNITTNTNGINNTPKFQSLPPVKGIIIFVPKSVYFVI